MKRLRHSVALVALTLVGLLGVRPAEAGGYDAYDEAQAYCIEQQGFGLECTVIQYGSACGSLWTEARLFVDSHSGYLACTYH